MIFKPKVPSMNKHELLLGFACLSLTCFSQLKAATRLEWKLAKGQQYAVESKQTVKQEYGNQVIDRTTLLDTSWIVNDVSKDGQALIESRVDRVQASIQFGDGPVASFDSSVEQQADGSARILSNVFRNVTKQSNAFQFSKLGNTLPPSSGDAPKKDEVSDQLIAKLGLVFPDKELSKGDQWKSKSVANLEVTNLKATNELIFEYDGPQEVEGQNLERITVRSTLSLEPEQNQEKINVKSHNIEGAILFNKEKGVLVSSRVQTNFEFDVEVTEAKIDHKISTVTEIKMKTKPSKEEKANKTLDRGEAIDRCFSE